MPIAAVALVLLVLSRMAMAIEILFKGGTLLGTL
jgi:hypothetical protein